ncbi:MAG: ribonuclease P protein component [Alphaproteobacteria bacterium PA2]|nr:MAG: ribonuclease P protein component [Alphaproteobacteria bacterium PA2]
MSEPDFPITRLKVRPDFLAAAKAKSCAKGAVVLQARARRDDAEAVRVGFTATKKVGGAVVRNRAKRRMRAAARQMVPLFGRPGHDYVLIARNGAPTRPWGRLLDDVKSALLSLRAESESPEGAFRRAPPPPI